MPLWVITSNLFSNYFVTDEDVRRTIKGVVIFSKIEY